MSQVTAAEDISQLGTILSVWAHPDDETFSCAALMAAAVRQGQKVVCLTATKGEAGVRDAQRWPPDQLADIRAHEMETALSVLGVHEHHWLGYRDGGCEAVDPTEAAAKIAVFIEDVRPDTILTFGPEGMTGHPDHCAVSRWVDAAVQVSGRAPVVYHVVELRETYENYLKRADELFDIYFNIDKPPLREARQCDIYYCLKPNEQAMKRRAFMAMPSQMEAMLNYFDEQLFGEVFGCESFIRAGT